MIGYIWKKTPKTAVTFNTIREGKYLQPETNRDGPGLARGRFRKIR